jgi:hypothetical protein
MKTIIKFSILLFVFTLNVAFTYKANPSCIGVYGVSEEDSSQIQLTLNADNTFKYQDFYDSKHKISTSGNWVQKGNKIILKSSELQLKFHHVWTLSDNGNQVKSRKGLFYYNLCKVR